LFPPRLQSSRRFVVLCRSVVLSSHHWVVVPFGLMAELPLSRRFRVTPVPTREQWLAAVVLAAVVVAVVMVFSLLFVVFIVVVVVVCYYTKYIVYLENNQKESIS
jgi:hypothetical protein